MKTDTYVNQLREHGEALAAAAAETGLDAAVPTCPGWTVRDLVGHVGQVHRWAASFVAHALTDVKAGTLAEAPADEELLDWYRAGHGQLVDTLRYSRDDLECWTFLPAPSCRTFWARRQAHETAIHRVDAESVVGRVPQLDARFAVDGIDELLLGFFSRPRGRLLADPETSLGVRAVDGADGDEWTIRIGPSGREVTRGVSRGTCVVSGRAADLYLLLWNRRGAEDVTVRGDQRVLDLWREKARVSWS